MRCISDVAAETTLIWDFFAGWKLAHQWTRLLDVGRTTTTELALETHIYHVGYQTMAMAASYPRSLR
jgi:hypothetical protein